MIQKSCKRIVCVLIAVCCLVLFSSQTQAREAEPSSQESKNLRVAFYPLDGFFEYGVNGKETGYGVELLDKISRYTGIHFTYVKADSWESTKQMLLDGKADVRMPGTMPANPSTTLEYTQRSIIDTYYALMTLKTRNDLYYEDYDTFQNLKIGVSESLYNAAGLEEELANANISSDNLVFFDGYNACREALETGKVDALISNIMDLDDEMKQLDRFNTVSNYISMVMGAPEIDQINEALVEINMDEAQAMSNLYKKWFPERVFVPLTKEELAYLGTIDSIQFAFPDGQGYLSRKEADGSFCGFFPEVSKLLCEKLGKSCKTIERNKKPVSDELTVYPDFYYDYVWAESCDVNITKPYGLANYYEMSRKNEKLDKRTCKVAAIKRLRLTSNYVLDHFRNSQIVWCDDYGDCMEAVYNRKADITYVNSYAAEYYLSLYRFSGISSTLTDYSNQVCIGVWGDDSEIMSSILEKTLMSVSEEELNNLMIRCTAQKPDQNLLVEWFYQNPFKSAVWISLLLAFLVGITFLILFMNRMRLKNRALQKATSAKQDFLARMSHDMRTPMNAIIGFSDFGKNSTTLVEARDYHGKIHIAGQYLLQLINDSLDLNKLESRKYELHKEPYDCTSFIEELNNILVPRAEEKGVSFTIQKENDGPSTLLFDRLRLQQIFVNLINNAIKFTKKGGHVSLSINCCLKEQKEVVVTFIVKDDGIGMSEDFQKEKLFKPFEQEQALKEVEGTGLGLSIVKELVEIMDGTIQCESAVNHGTTFTVTIPTEQVETVQKAAGASKGTKVDLTGKRILLCEDHPLNREIVEKLLKRVGIVVENAENGQIGVALFEASKPGYYAGILMDIRMPVMDGLEAARQIRKLDRADAATVPIIALSANAFDEDREASKKAGMNAHLAKPIDTLKLYETLQELL